MTYRVRITEGAYRDVDRLADFLLVQAEGDLDVVDRALETLWRSLDQLEFSPFGYRKVDDDNLLLREMVVGFGATGYVVLFEIEDAHDVVVLAVRHQREDDYY